MALMNFLRELAQNPRLQLAFRNDPMGMARAAGLTEEQCAIVATRDSSKLRALMAEQGREQRGAVVYSSETAVIYSPETAVIYSPESGPQSAMIYSAESA